MVAVPAHAADAPNTAAAAAGAAKVQAPGKQPELPSKTFTSPAAKSKAAGQTVSGRAAGSELSVGLTAVTEGAYGVKLTSAYRGSTGAVKTTVEWGDGTKTEGSATGSQETTHKYAELGSYTVTETVTDAAGVSTANTVQVFTNGSAYFPYAPTRFLDTRNTGKVANGTSTKVKVGGANGIPAGVTAVVLNVTVTNTNSGGFITAFASGTTRPETSNLNFNPGQTVPNLTIVPVGSDGYVELYNGGWAPVDLIADVAGYFANTSGAGYQPVAPARLVDTRSSGKVGGYGTLGVQIAGNGGVPSGVKAVALNVTVTNPNNEGHLTVFPSGQSAPTASNLNFRGGQTIANSVIVPVGADGRIEVRNGSWGAADVIVDVVGYYSDSATSAYLPLPPERIVDTRAEGFPLGSREYLWMPLSDGAPEYTTWVFNATAVNTTVDGHLSVAPDPNTLAQYVNGTAGPVYFPSVSTLNWKAGETVPNLVQANPGSTGVIDVFNGSWGAMDLLVDLSGVYVKN